MKTNLFLTMSAVFFVVFIVAIAPIAWKAVFTELDGVSFIQYYWSLVRERLLIVVSSLVIAVTNLGLAFWQIEEKN